MTFSMHFNSGCQLQENGSRRGQVSQIVVLGGGGWGGSENEVLIQDGKCV